MPGQPRVDKEGVVYTLYNTDLYNTDLYNTDLYNTDLYNTDLYSTDLYSTDLYFTHTHQYKRPALSRLPLNANKRYPDIF